MNPTRLPKEEHLPDWARRDNKVTKADRVEYDRVAGTPCSSLEGLDFESQLTASYADNFRGFLNVHRKISVLRLKYAITISILSTFLQLWATESVIK